MNDFCFTIDCMSNVCKNGTKCCQSQHKIPIETKIKKIVEELDYDLYKEMYIENPEDGERFNKIFINIMLT